MVHVTRRSGMETQVSIPRDMSAITEVDDGTGFMSSTRLACTVGPASSDVATLEALLQAGMVVARFDFSYGDRETHQAVANNLKTACASTGKNCATMLDTRGPEVIVMNRAKGEVLELKSGQEVVISCDGNVRTTASTIVVSYPGFADSGLEPGSSVYVGEYLFSGAEQSSAYLTVKQVGESRLLCECNNDCKLSGLQLIAHFMGIPNPLPALPPSDREVIASFGVANEINFVSLSFARSAADIQECRLFLDSVGLTRTQIVAKIENREGLVNYEEIVGAAEAVVLSRGNLGIDLPPEKIFVAQRMVLKACNFAGKPVFATRVCDTMTDVPRPTRAEATDVANLVLDGVDGILLGSETFNGFHPVTAARTVQAICRQAERCYRSDSFYQQLQLQAGAYISNPNMDRTEAIASAAVRAVEKLSASLIVAFTITGRTARYLAKYRPPVPILLFVLEPKTATGAAAQEQGSGASALLASHPLPATDLEPAAPSSHHMAQSLLLLRSMVPVAADPAASSMSESALLEYAFFQGEVMGMVKPGDHVVVLQCPRPGTEASMFPERGVLKLVEMADEVASSVAKRAGSANIMRPTVSHDNIRVLA